MSVKINSLKEEEIRKIGDAFADHEYAEAEWGMGYLAKNRRAISDYICAYVRMLIQERSLYSTSDRHEAFIGFHSSDHHMSLSSVKEVLGAIPGNIDISHSLTMAKGLKKAGKGYGSILAKLKIPHIYVSLVAVTKEYQGQGYMRKLLDIAFEEGRRHAVPVILDTDAELKRDKYAHLGMKCVTTQHFTEGVEMYGMVYEPDNIPKEWKSETVLEDMRILRENSNNIWDRFAPVYTGFVTGTPGNRKAYEALFKRIKTMVQDKEILEIATGPGVIAKQVASESKRMIATDYAEKMLAVARRGNVADNLTFEHADACDLPYDDKSFDVVIIANALHIIPDREKVLAEIHRVLRPDGILIAPNFVHDNRKKISNMFTKALSLAGITFETKWDAEGYVSFINENGFKVIKSKQLSSTIPLVYTECVKIEEMY